MSRRQEAVAKRCQTHEELIFQMEGLSLSNQFEQQNEEENKKNMAHIVELMSQLNDLEISSSDVKNLSEKKNAKFNFKTNAIILLVFDFLDFRCLMSIMMVCKDWHSHIASVFKCRKTFSEKMK